MTVIGVILEDERVWSWNQLYSGKARWDQRKTEATRTHLLVKSVCQELGTYPVLVYPVHLVFICYFKNHPIDCSNLMLKYYEDGLIYAGLLKNDSPAYVSGNTVFSFVDRKHPRVEIYIYDRSATDPLIRDLSVLLEEAKGTPNRQPTKSSKKMEK